MMLTLTSPAFEHGHPMSLHGEIGDDGEAHVHGEHAEGPRIEFFSPCCRSITH